MSTNLWENDSLARTITKAASRQTYYTIALLVDGPRQADAFRAYAYFRWLDDQLDEGRLGRAERLAFVQRQADLIEAGYRGCWPARLAPEERLAAELIWNDREPASGLQTYMRQMLAVMAFDAERRGRLISPAELQEYTRWLATAVTEAMHHFIGHDAAAPRGPERYAAVTAAHLTHMLRDMQADVEAGYINIPREILTARGLAPHEFDRAPYRAWVRERVEQARAGFQTGRRYLAQVACRRCRLAGYAYIARFEGVLDAVEREGYRLRRAYPERQGLSGAGALMRSLLTSLGAPGRAAVAGPQPQFKLKP